MKIRTLILTDHRGHSDQNSVYALARCLAVHPRSLHVDIASRGSAQNTALFQEGALAQVQGLGVRSTFGYDPTAKQFTHGLLTLHPEDYDLIWLRLPHPIAPALAAALDALDRDTTTVVVNRPAGMLETGNKAWLLNWRAHSAPLELVQSPLDVRAFAARFKIVLKPLRAHGGRGITLVDGDVAECDGRRQTLTAWLAANERELREDGFLAMQYMENVDRGDKRILVVNGKILGASLRLPPPGSWLCNVAQGGTSVRAEVTPAEAAMVAAISPSLLQKGVVFYGMDTLENAAGERILSELNTLSIGGFPQAEAQTGRPVVRTAIDELIAYFDGVTAGVQR